MLVRTRPSLTHELFAPSRERVERTIEITLMTMIVVVISMTFQTPSPALSAYLVFFVAKEDSCRSILTSIIFIVAIVAVIGVVFLLAATSLNHPSLRILIIAAASFVMFFLGRTSKLAPLASTLGLVMAYALDLEQKAPIGEIETRILLYATLFTIFPIVVVLVFNILFGRHPERLLRIGLASRLEAMSDALISDSGVDRQRVRSLVEAGNIELLTELKMIGLFRRLPASTSARLKALITVTYSQLLIVYASPVTLLAQRPDREAIADRLRHLAGTISYLPAAIDPSVPTAGEISEADPSQHRFVTLTDMVERIVSGGPLPDSGPPVPRPAKSGFFKPDAFSNADGQRFAVKATAAVMICYLTFNILDWPGIGTCMITCFIVALSTVGESTQKMSLRLLGCTLGAVLGTAAIVIVLPLTTNITGLLMLVAVITVPAAYIAVGSPRVAYIGFQLAFAAYLCVLQGSEPKFDLTIARDRFIGIVFGNLVVFAIFTQFYVTSLLPGLSRDLVAILEGCRLLLKAMTDAEPALAISDRVAGLCALVAKIDNEVVAYGFEKRPTRFARLHALSCQLIESALHDVVADVATIATLAAPLEDGPTKEAFERRCDLVDRRLLALSTALAEHEPILVGPADGEPRGYSNEFDALHQHLDGRCAAALRYRRILRKEADDSYA